MSGRNCVRKKLCSEGTQFIGNPKHNIYEFHPMHLVIMEHIMYSYVMQSGVCTKVKVRGSHHFMLPPGTTRKIDVNLRLYLVKNYRCLTAVKCT